MPYITTKIDQLKLAYTFTLGLDLLPTQNPKTPAIISVGDTFIKNIMRLKRMMLTPAYIGDLANRIQRYTDIAEFEITGTITKERFPPDEQGEEIFARMRDLLREDSDRVNAHADEEAVLLQIVKDAVETGGGPAVLLANSPPQSAGFEGLLLSYVTNMWTIFETLAGDLWEAAINEKPDILAQLKGKSSRLRKGRGRSAIDSPPSHTREDEASKLVRLDLIQFHRWNLSNKMGTVLKSKYDFSRLETLREAYACAFCEKADDIDQILSDDALDVLSALRNIIVHKGAVADKEYLARCKYLSKLPKAEEGNAIPLDGEVISYTIGEAIYCSAYLVDAVDKWVTAH
jgi:hypothetical protein